MKKVKDFFCCDVKDSFLYKDIKDFNIHLLIIFGVLFISIIGSLSYAAFSTESISSNNIHILVKNE